MSLENIRSECSEYAALLQPHVDGELADEEQHRVSDHLEKCGACRTAVSEQMWVRATLRSIDREAAPTGLRANVLAALDVADAEQPEHAPGAEADGPDPKGQIVSIDARRGGRLRDLMRGGMVMIPAAAVAAGLFFVARGGLEPVQQLPGPGLSAAMSRAPVAGPPAEPRREPRADPAGAPSKTDSKRPALSELDEIRPQLDFPLQVAPSKPEERVQLVGARLDPRAGTASLGASLRYRISDEQRIRHIIDRQRPIGGPEPSGTTVVFRGQPYTVSHDAGAPTLHFEHGGVSHQLTLEGSVAHSGKVKVDSPDFSVLLDMAYQLAREPSGGPVAGR